MKTNGRSDSRFMSGPPGMAATVIGLLLVYWLLAVSASTNWSHTSDELPHITAGYAYNMFGDYRIQPENGILPQRVFGLPGLWFDAKFPDNEEFWRTSKYWQLGWDYFYGLGNPTDRLVLWARGLNALFGAALGFLIFVVARKIHGTPGGFLALGFYVLCPNFLAHGALATSDMAATFFLTLAPWLFWHHLERRDLPSGIAAGVASGLALVAKFNGVLLAPIYLILLIADGAIRGSTRKARRIAVNLSLAVMQGIASVLIIWAFYGFRFSTAAPDRPPLETYAWSWDFLMRGIGWKAEVIQFARDWHLLPEAWLYGLSNVLAGSVERHSFLAGEHSTKGFKAFFPTVFFLKTTLAVLVAAAIGLVASAIAVRRNPVGGGAGSIACWVPIIAAAAVIGGTALAGNLSIGHRHILGVYPALFIAIGSLAAFRRGWRVLVPCLLLLGQLAESVAIRPHYIAHFNMLAGGPAKAHRIVVDSSLDWGQGLPALREWLAGNRREDEPVYLAFFGSAWPPHYGVRPTHFLPSVNIARPPSWAGEFKPGLYCISATTLAEVYSDLRGPWRTEWSAELANPNTSADRLAELRTSLLCRHLRRRTADGHAGYAILIHRLSAEELGEALTP